MKWLLMIYVLSVGQYQESHISAQNCYDAMLEAQLVRGDDLWTALCISPDDTVEFQISKELGP